MHLSALLFGLICCAAVQQPSAAPNTVLVENCTLFLADEAKVPAQEGGVIKSLQVKDGQFVKRDELLVQLDDSIPQQQVNVAKAELISAKEEAENKIPREYAVASWRVANAELEVSNAANRKVAGSVPQVNIDKLDLEKKQMELSVKKADMDTRIAVTKLNVKKAQLEASRVTLDHRQLKSPLDGQVRKTFKHVGEWLNTGEPVVHVVRMDRFYVEGSVLAAETSHAKILGKPVTVEVIIERERLESERGDIARFHTETVRGNIVFADPMIEPSGEYLVRAEVDNIKKNGQWVLYPGMTATMTIHLK